MYTVLVNYDNVDKIFDGQGPLGMYVLYFYIRQTAGVLFSRNSYDIIMFLSLSYLHYIQIPNISLMAVIFDQMFSRVTIIYCSF